MENVAQSTPGETVSLIIVDDEGAIRRGLRASVGWESMGITVAGTAADGEAALALMESAAPDIVITDIKMPGMDGLSFIRACGERGLSARFIILSGFNDFEFAREAIRYGVRSYLLKPVRIAELRKEALDLKRGILEERSRLREQARNRSRAAESGSIIRENRLLALATGEDAASSSDALSEAFPDGLPEAPYRLVLFRPSYDEAADADPAACDQREAIRALRESIRKTAPDVFGLPGGSALAAVLSRCPGQEDAARDLARIMDGAPPNLKAGVGLAVLAVGQLRASFDSAQEALGYFMYPDSGNVVFADAVSATPPPPAGRASEYSRGISELIRLGDGAALRQELEDFFDDLFFVPAPPPEYVRGMCVYLLVDVEKNILETCRLEDGAVFDTHPTLIVHTLVSIQEIKEYVETTLAGMMEVVARSRRAANPMIERACAYIRENALKKIRIEDLAERENLSASYFAALFKEGAGESFRDYLIRCKLDRAKDLMTTAKLSIAEISEILGYEDYRSFNRAFKRHTGYTPSVYQRAVGRGEARNGP